MIWGYPYFWKHSSLDSTPVWFIYFSIYFRFVNQVDSDSIETTFSQFLRTTSGKEVQQIWFRLLVPLYPMKCSTCWWWLQLGKKKSLAIRRCGISPDFMRFPFWKDLKAPLVLHMLCSSTSAITSWAGIQHHQCPWPPSFAMSWKNWHTKNDTESRYSIPCSIDTWNHLLYPIILHQSKSRGTCEGFRTFDQELLKKPTFGRLFVRETCDSRQSQHLVKTCHTKNKFSYTPQMLMSNDSHGAIWIKIQACIYITKRVDHIRK